MCVCVNVKGIFIQLFYFCRVFNFVYKTYPQATTLERVYVCVFISGYFCLFECVSACHQTEKDPRTKTPPLPLAPFFICVILCDFESEEQKGIRSS